MGVSKLRLNRMTLPPTCTLHIDIEGGFGGSSRSLFELVSRFDRNRIEPIIVCRRDGPIASRYMEQGITCIHVPEIVSYAPRNEKSFKNLIATSPKLIGMLKAVRAIHKIATKHNVKVVHLNYEGLFVMAPFLRRRLGLPMVGHSRTQIPDNMWGRWETRTLDKNVSHMFFISPAEEAAFRKHSNVPGEILWNIASTPTGLPVYPDHPVAVALGNIDEVKGSDRLVDVAAALDALNAPPLRIDVYGSARNNPSFYQDLVERVTRLGLQERISFLGHTNHPEKILQTSLALIRPSRWNDPWGRDVIEATRHGLPSLATGTAEFVIENEKTGFLFEEFSAEEMARTLIRLATDRSLWTSLSKSAFVNGEKKFSGEQQVHRATDVFERLAING